MTFAIHAWKDGQSVVTMRINPDAAVDKARSLESFGWQVCIINSAGRRFEDSEFHQIRNEQNEPRESASAKFA
jgi:hypothetical protein